MLHSIPKREDPCSFMKDPAEPAPKRMKYEKLLVGGTAEVEDWDTSKPLVGCGEMDQQLADAASAKLKDLHEGLLNELLQHVDFQKLLYLRRLCWRWHDAITSELVPYLPYVAFAMDLDSHRDDDDNQLWKLVDDIVLLVEKPQTLLMFGCNKTIPPHQRLIETFWDYYDSKLDIYGRNSCPIQKVIYANTIVNSEAFCCALVCEAGFQTVLYHCTVNLSLFELSFAFLWEEAPEWSAKFNGRQFSVKVVGKDCYVLSEEDLSLMEYPVNHMAPDSNLNPAAQYFATKHFQPVTGKVLLDFLASIDVYLVGCEHGNHPEVSALVEQIMERFDPNNTEAVQCFRNKDVSGFISRALPLAVFVFYRFIKEMGYC